jgi:hypothetical protein
MLKISCDIDGVLADFNTAYFSRFGTPKKDSEITKNVQTILSKDKDFWLNLPVLNELNFVPKQYTTSRIIPKQWIKEYLSKELFPKAPVYQIYGYTLSKYSKIKMGGCHLHVDDSLSVFLDLNLRGIPCLLLDSPNNQKWGPIGRIYSLDIEEIEDIYHLFKNTMFPHFKELYENYK